MAVRVTPHAQLVAAAEAAYASEHHGRATATLLNVLAVVALTEPRTLTHHGVRYTAPPLSYRHGLLLSAAQAKLRTLRQQEASLGEQAAAAHLAGGLLRRCLRPIRWWQRVPWRGRRPIPGTPVELEALCGWLLDVRDESGLPPAGGGQVIDLADVLANFVRELPRWVNAEGVPASWAKYVFGCRHLNRVRAREDLRGAQVARVAAAEQKEYKDWVRSTQPFTGWGHG